MPNPQAFAQATPSLTISPVPGAAGGASTAASFFQGSYTGNQPTANPQTVPFRAKQIVIFDGATVVGIVNIDPNTVDPSTNVQYLSGAPTFTGRTGTSGVTATSWDPQALNTLYSVTIFNTVGHSFTYFMIG